MNDGHEDYSIDIVFHSISLHDEIGLLTFHHYHLTHIINSSLINGKRFIMNRQFYYTLRHRFSDEKLFHGL